MSLKLNRYIQSIHVINNNSEKFFFNIIIWSFGALSLLYIFFLGNMVLNIVERRNLEGSARALSSEVGNLELKYLSMSSGVDLTLSHSMGFKETKATFVTRKTGSSISLRPPLGSSELLDSMKIIPNDI